MKVSNAKAPAVTAQLEELGPNPSADDLAGVLASSRGATKAQLKPLAAAMQKALDRTFEKAAQLDQPDLLSVYAEDAGKLKVMLEAIGAPTAASVKKTEGLMSRIVDLRVGNLRAMANGTTTAGAADAIRNSEDAGSSLKMDLSRLYRYGFDKPDLDVDALVFAVKRSAVDAFTR